MHHIQMAKFQCLWFPSFCFLLFFTFMAGKTNAAQEARKAYIVYMGAISEKDRNSLPAQHMSILKEVINNGSPPEKFLVRSYIRSFNGFAANLTEQEYQKLNGHEEVVSVFPSKTLQLMTTESWDFTGLPVDVRRNLTMEKDIIIGIFDTGIWPESKSFSDVGIGSVPKKWKGTCDGGKNFTCNRKIIGARKYGDYQKDARDQIGHGSHTASTAAGNHVPNASFYGIASGTARGGVPSARIAMYKICSELGCRDIDILAAFDDAIADGVDIISASLGPRAPIYPEKDSMAIGSFHAIQKGILTIQSAGNSGSLSGYTGSVAPWLFNIAATTTKRKIISKVNLKSGKAIEGRAINSYKLNGTDFPLVYGPDASNNLCNPDGVKACRSGCTDSEKVNGKILICEARGGYEEAIRQGAIASILKSDRANDVSTILPSPGSILSSAQFKEILAYYKSTQNPRANILESESVQNKIAPRVASFSSRGPNKFYPDILKPDIAAPGVNILAAYSPVTHPTFAPSDERSVNYSFLSGTSMSCPHVTGAVAYVKSYHPDWSPSALKSALMTTAQSMYNNQSAHGDAEFSYGAGFFDPVKALNPGLVYETTKEDYVKLICSMHLDDNSNTLRKMFGDKTTSCTPNDWSSKPKDLNYPSMAAHVDLMSKNTFSVTFPRTVTNVGIASSTYVAKSYCIEGCKVTVNPSTLTFQTLNEKKSFNVTISGENISTKMISASIEWVDTIHHVRSPIVIY